jgi:hypothetical protein
VGEFRESEEEENVASMDLRVFAKITTSLLPMMTLQFAKKISHDFIIKLTP